MKQILSIFFTKLPMDWHRSADRGLGTHNLYSLPVTIGLFKGNCIAHVGLGEREFDTADLVYHEVKKKTTIFVYKT